MARRTQDVIYQVTGQTIEHRLMSGRPASGTFRVFRDTQDDDSTEPEFTGALVVDSVNTTVNVASGPNELDPRRLNLASTTGIVTGRKYLLSESGLGEWVEPLEVLADRVLCRYALRRNYTTSATFQSTYVTAAVDDTWVADEDHLSRQADPNPDYRVRLQMVNASGATEIHYEFFDLVRALMRPGVDMIDVAERWPSLIDELPDRWATDRGATVLDAAWRKVRADLHEVDLNDVSIRDMEAIDELVILQTRVILVEAGYTPPRFEPAEFLEIAADAYTDYLEANFKAKLRRDVDTGTSGNAGSTLAAQTSYWAK